MTNESFYNLVRKYREAQKMYDRTKHYVYAADLINLSRDIDSQLKANLEEQEKRNQSKIMFSQYEDLSQ